MNVKKQINICLCTKDDYYIKYTASLLESLHCNKNCNYQYVIYILWWELSENTKNNLNSIDDEFVINYISFKDEDVFGKYKNIPKKDYIYLYRLFIWDYINDVDKIIYMDNDIVINWDISELFEIDLWDNIIWATHDCVNRSIYSKKKLDHYFNSWVLIIDLIKWNNENIWHKILELLNHRKSDFWQWQDQDGLNYVLDWKWKVISPKWNWINVNTFTNKWTQYTNEEFYELRHPIIAHYAWGHHRPWWWLICVHSKRYLYFKYIFKSKYWDFSDIYKFPLRVFTSNCFFRFLYKITVLFVQCIYGRLFIKW